MNLPLNQVILGDCLEVMRGFPDKSIDLVLTDPPYFISAQTTAGTREKSYRKGLADMSIVSAFFKSLMVELDRITKDTGTFYVFCDPSSFSFLYKEMYPYCKNIRTIIWDRMVGFNGYTWRRSHELILWGERNEAPRIPTGDNDVLHFRGVLQKDRVHPVQKPVELLEHILKRYPKDYVVMDCFSGSCSTLLAAQNLGMNYFGVEAEEKYVNICKERLATTTTPLF